MFLYINSWSLCPPQLNYKAGYEKTKHQYTLSQDLPEIQKAKENAALCSDVSSDLHVLYPSACTHFHPNHHFFLYGVKTLKSIIFVVDQI